MRVQFTVSKEEWETLERAADVAGYPSVPSYCKDVALEQRSFREMWEVARANIAAWPSDRPFHQGDVIRGPGALGRLIWKNQDELGIECVGTDNYGNIYRKKAPGENRT